MAKCDFPGCHYHYYMAAFENEREKRSVHRVPEKCMDTVIELLRLDVKNPSYICLCSSHFRADAIVRQMRGGRLYHGVRKDVPFEQLLLVWERREQVRSMAPPSAHDTPERTPRLKRKSSENKSDIYEYELARKRPRSSVADQLRQEVDNAVARIRKLECDLTIAKLKISDYKSKQESVLTMFSQNAAELSRVSRLVTELKAVVQSYQAEVLSSQQRISLLESELHSTHQRLTSCELRLECQNSYQTDAYLRQYENSTLAQNTPVSPSPLRFGSAFHGHTAVMIDNSVGMLSDTAKPYKSEGDRLDDDIICDDPFLPNLHYSRSVEEIKEWLLNATFTN